MPVRSGRNRRYCFGTVKAMQTGQPLCQTEIELVSLHFEVVVIEVAAFLQRYIFKAYK